MEAFSKWIGCEVLLLLEDQVFCLRAISKLIPKSFIIIIIVVVVIIIVVIIISCSCLVQVILKPGKVIQIPILVIIKQSPSESNHFSSLICCTTFQLIAYLTYFLYINSHIQICLVKGNAKNCIGLFCSQCQCSQNVFAHLHNGNWCTCKYERAWASVECM